MLRNVTTLVALLAVIVISAVNGSAQSPLTRSVAVTAGTYAEIFGGTVIYNNNSPAWPNAGSTQVTLPFNVVFAGTTYNSVWVDAGGLVSFGSPTLYLSPLDNGTPVVSAFGNRLSAAAGGTVSHTVTGAAPNRVWTVQWKDATREYADNIGRDRYNFQIKVYETNSTVDNSRVDIVYGSMVVNSPIMAYVGASNGSTEIIGLNVQEYLASWAKPHFTNSQVASMFSQNTIPQRGTTVAFRHRLAPAHNNDAGVVAITNSSSKFNAGVSQTIEAVVGNWGSNNLDSVTVNWSINGQAQTPVKYYPQPALAPGQTRTVTLGSYTFAAMSLNTIDVSTSRPNGQADINTGNDSHITQLAPRVSGTVVIAQNGNPGAFPSLYAMLRHVSVAGLNGDLTAEVLSGTYRGEVIIPNINNTSGSQAAARLTIQPRAGASVVLTETIFPTVYGNLYNDVEEHCVLRVVDGGTLLTLRNLTIRADNASRYHTVMGSTGVQDIRIEGCTFTGAAGYVSIASTVQTPGVRLKNGNVVVVTGSTFSNHFEALKVEGGSSLVSSNKFDNVVIGITVIGGTPRVLSNTVTTCDCYGFVSGINVVSTTDADVMKNVVNAILTTGSVTGISVTSSGNAEIWNNMASVSGTGTVTGLRAEAVINPFPVAIFHNTVNVTGLAASSTALNVTASGGTIIGGNNIFHNFGTGSGGGFAATFSSTTPNPLSAWDFNNLMTTGTNLVNWGGTFVPRNAGTNPLGSWRAGSGRDQNSSSVAVNFVGGTDLHLLSIQRELWGSNLNLSVINDDIDGNVRTKPYMGADEIRPVIAMVRQPLSAYVCVGAIDTMIAIADVTAGATTTYQWFKDGVELTGQTGNILVLNNVQYSSAGVYTCLVKANDGTNFIQLMSNGATVMVVRPTQITDQPSSQPVADGGTFNLTVSAEAIGAPDNFIPTYKWMKRDWNANTSSYEDTPIDDNGRITGSNSSMLTVRNTGAADTAGTYVCRVTGYCGTVTSKSARVFIPLVAVSNMTPNLCEGGTLNLDLRANPTVLPEGNAAFQWYKDGVKLAGQTGAALEVKNFRKADNGTYSCVMTFGTKELTFASNDVAVTAGTAPEFTRQPEGFTICEGKVMTLSAAASGDNVTFQWMKGTQVLANETASTLSRVASDVDGGSYTVVVTNICGSKTSTAVDVVVDPLAKISTQPADVQFTQGGTITMSVVAAGRNIYNYQWYVNDVAIPGATNATLEIKNATTANAGSYYCEVTNLCGAVKTRNAVASITTGVTDDIVAGGYLLSTAFPNPTFDASSVTFAVPASQHVRVVVSDLMGRELGVIVNEVVESGSHAVKFSASELNLTAGTYNVTMNAGGFVATQQVVVVK